MGKINLIINPGSGPCDGDEKNAIKNMGHFIADHDEESLECLRVPEKDYGDGRFAFFLYKVDGTRYHEIQMPGLPLDRVRYMGEKHQNIWDFPRLYVDGSSWVWVYGILNHEEDWNEPE